MVALKPNPALKRLLAAVAEFESLTSQPQMSSYGSLCTEFYDLDKPNAPPDALDFYTTRDRAAGGRVLEPMCGSGRFLAPMLRAGLVIDGTDSSHPMIAACERRLTFAGVCAELFEQPLEALSLPYSYSLAFIPSGSIGLLTTDKALFAALTRLREHLLPGATLLLEFTEPDNEPSTPDQTELAPRTVDCFDGAVITYTCCAHRQESSGSTLFRGKYVKSLNDRVIGTEDEDLTVRSFSPAQLSTLLRDCGCANSTFHTSKELPFLREGGCVLVEAS
jgi:SAM-dependent methyltransferase